MKDKRDEREKSYYANYKPMKLSEARSIVGTCMDMCPEFERLDREVSQELHLFETVNSFSLHLEFYILRRFYRLKVLCVLSTKFYLCFRFLLKCLSTKIYFGFLRAVAKHGTQNN
jgi:hypothetical protein